MTRISAFFLIVTLLVARAAGANECGQDRSTPDGIDLVFCKPEDQSIWGAAARSIGIGNFQKSYALIVGVSEFEDYTPLPTQADPIRMQEYLINEAGYDYVHVLTDKAATLPRIRELMVEVLPAAMTPDDRFLFYWSGHGVTRDTLRGQSGYLPISSSGYERYTQMISMREFEQWDDLIPASQVLYLLDSCFSGLAGVARKSDLTAVTLEQLSGPARHILTAGTAGEETIAIDRLGGSVFTAAVIDGLRGAAEADNALGRDGLISINELQNYVTQRVALERTKAGWPKPITPQLRDLGLNEGAFFFRVPGATPDTPPAESPSTDASPANANIRFMHDALSKLGYDPGPVADQLTMPMQLALILFQIEVGQEPTGELNAATRGAMLRALADPDRKSGIVSQGGGDPNAPSTLPELTQRHEIMFLDDPAIALAPSPNGSQIAVGYLSGTSRLIDPNEGRILATSRSPDNGAVHGFAFLGNERELAIGYEQGKIEILDLKSGDLFLLSKSDKPIVDLWYDHDARSVTITSNPQGTGDVRTLLLNGEQIERHWTFSTDIKAIAQSDNGTFTALATSEGLRVGAGSDIANWWTALGDVTLWTVAFTPDGDHVVSAGRETPIRVWEAETGRFLREIDPKDTNVFSMDVSPDGKYLAAVGDGRAIRIWDLGSGALAAMQPDAHAASILKVAFSSDGRAVYSAGNDGATRIWDFPPALIAEQQPEVLPGRTGSLCAACPEFRRFEATTFQMGYDHGKPEFGPLMTVQIPAFELSTTEVTKGQYAAFAEEFGGSLTSPISEPNPTCFVWAADRKRMRRTGFTHQQLAGDPNEPMACVSFKDAIAYVDWLNSKVPGTPFRLPTEAEMEWALHGGSAGEAHMYNGADDTSGFPWRETEIEDNHADVAPVASYDPDRNGLYDLRGNLWEWTADCWSDRHDRNESHLFSGHCPDGSAVLKGGSFDDPFDNFMPYVRQPAPLSRRQINIGFRIARDAN